VRGLFETGDGYQGGGCNQFSGRLLVGGRQNYIFNGLGISYHLGNDPAHEGLPSDQT
jgi:hypothetical protein